MNFARLFFPLFLVALLTTGHSETTVDEKIDAAFHLIVTSDEFPWEQYRQFSAEQVKAGSDKVLAAVRDSSSVYRVDFDVDGSVDCVIQVSLHARNSRFFVVRRVESGWQIECTFVGQGFSLLGFGLRTPTLRTVENHAGGNLSVSSYTFRDDRYVRTETHRERTSQSPR
jgi:hypothetical protein